MLSHSSTSSCLLTSSACSSGYTHHHHHHGSVLTTTTTTALMQCIRHVATRHPSWVRKCIELIVPGRRICRAFFVSVVCLLSRTAGKPGQVMLTMKKRQASRPLCFLVSQGRGKRGGGRKGREEARNCPYSGLELLVVFAFAVCWRWVPACGVSIRQCQKPRDTGDVHDMTKNAGSLPDTKEKDGSGVMIPSLPSL